ncbi:zinc-dependent metalloprotease [Sphingomonas sp. BIUV-7]|uniref:Zinc-dependent metalloprotease n=1 Tax=Sphingomonas natans TaxID=3063330 RepID=A0ABT8Y8Y6_9SPHN|nr:zinc-dependent metalloprotease [Sphingomonas sp. BIUV-7]MDO6414784.1 zinc-dependent metalloprotease [Sphingomonas sp. BIUV-7]
MMPNETAGRRAIHLLRTGCAAIALLGLGGMALAAPPKKGGDDTSARAGPAPMHADGYVPFTFDAAKNKVLIEVPAFDSDVLYFVSAATGGGEVELPFDRGVQESMVIHFVRAGQKVLVEEQNLAYRSVNGSAAAKQNVADSFPTSVLAALPIESEAGGKVMVDATALFNRDAANIEADMRRSNQGAFRYDPARFAFYPKRMKAFPDNTEIETVATFSGDAPGNLIRVVTPDAKTVTMRIHHSFLRPPAIGNFRPRDGDPRIGVGLGGRFKDFSKLPDDAPGGGFIGRYRLEKKDPSAALSEPVKPITFYFDTAIPDPIRFAMKQGLLWWNKAFEAAGFKNAIVALDLPADVDPMDIRYPTVLWIDRDERGFSSGGSYRDPRTGELIGTKTHMDSFRIRTIGNFYDAYSGGLPADGTGIDIADPSILSSPDVWNAMPKGQRDMILERQALLTAHELGHSIGFGHNFASSLNNQASVMEYPSPRVKVTNGKLDLSEAFQKQIGEYDKYMVRYAYTPFAPAQEKAGLDAIIADMRAHNLIYTPSDDPRWTAYDDRATPTEYLHETAEARKIMLATYGQNMLKADEPVGNLRDARLWMVYLHQRWAIDSGVKYIGGIFTNIVVKGETLPPTEFIPTKLQHETLDGLMDIIEPKNLVLPESLLVQLTPDPDNGKEDLSKDDMFDQLRAARILAGMVLEPLFNPDRAARLVALQARQAGAVTLPEVFDAVLAKTWHASATGTAEERAVLRATQAAALDSMMILGAAKDTSPEARAYALDRLASLAGELKGKKDGDPLTSGFYRQSARDIERYLEEPAKWAPKTAVPDWGGSPRSRYTVNPGAPL